MDTPALEQTLTILQGEYPKWQVPIVTLIAERSNDPYQVLISTLLSLRTKDEVTTLASRRLFAQADTPKAMVELSEEVIQELIYPVGFYKTKARNLIEVSRLLLERHGGRVPDDLDTLLTLPGVGRKTANLVLTLGFGLPGICVDTHVHRISNRFGYVKTRTPEETEMALRDTLPAPLVDSHQRHPGRLWPRVVQTHQPLVHPLRRQLPLRTHRRGAVSINQIYQ